MRQQCLLRGYVFDEGIGTAGNHLKDSYGAPVARGKRSLTSALHSSGRPSEKLSVILSTCSSTERLSISTRHNSCVSV